MNKSLLKKNNKGSMARRIVIDNKQKFVMLRLKIISTSMSPKIKVGDVVFSKKPTSNNLIGRVVCYYNKHNDFITHRVMKIFDNKCYLKADKVEYLDKPIAMNRIIGLIYRIDRKGKFYSLESKSEIMLGKWIVTVFLLKEKKHNLMKKLKKILSIIR